MSSLITPVATSLCVPSLEGYFNDETLLADLDQALPENAKRKLIGSSRKRVVGILVTKEAHRLMIF